MLTLTKPIFPNPALSYIQEYVGVTVAGQRWLWLAKKKSGKSGLSFLISPELQGETSELLDKNNLSFQRGRNYYGMTVDKESIEKHSDVLVSLMCIW